MYQGNMYSGGQGVYLHYITRELVKLGHEVHVISGRPYPRLADGVVHHKLHTYTLWAFLDGRDEHAYDDAPQAFLHPWNFYEFASTRVSLGSLFFSFSVRAYKKLAELERETGPFDLVHDNQTLGYGILAMKKLMGKRVVASLHHPLAIDKANNLREAKTLARRLFKQRFVTTFDELDAVLARQPFLGGDAPNRSDITLAALLAPVCRVPKHRMQWPALPPELADLEASLSGRPTWNHVLRMYRDHRKANHSHAARA